MLAFGNSITAGLGVGSNQSWPSLLAKLTGWRIINAGLCGDTSMAGKSRISSSLSDHHPKLVIIEIGGNDFLSGYSQQEVKENVRSMIKAARNAGSQIVLLAIPRLWRKDRQTGQHVDAVLYKELGEEENILVISNLISSVLSSRNLLSDDVHPTPLPIKDCPSIKMP